MLESLYSKQVSVPHLNKDFPLSKEAHNEPLFKHITFLEDDVNAKYRLVPVNHNNIREYNLYQKVVPINISENKNNKFRIKAILSEEIHGITESHWITEKDAEPSKASTHNQYRIRGISNKGQRSDWMYSELRDIDNDLIVYNMIYDVLDLLLTVHDDQLDYVLDHSISDVFAKILLDSHPDYMKLLGIEDNKEISLKELISLIGSKSSLNFNEEFMALLGEKFLILSDSISKEFKETLRTSPEEFAELYRSYNAIDQYQEQKGDFLGLLMEIFLEEHYEKIVQESNIEVFLQNTEEMGIYLNSNYEFDIKDELITSVSNISSDDHFVTTLNDAVQLITEPIVYEEIVYKKEETVEKFLRLALAELFVPIAAIEEKLIELETDLADEHQTTPSDQVIEFSTIESDENFIRNLLVHDVIETVVKGDLEPLNSIHGTFIDQLLDTAIDNKMALMLSYHFEEWIDVFNNIGESFRYSYNYLFRKLDEQKQIDFLEKNNTEQTRSLYSLRESYKITSNELAHITFQQDNHGLEESILTSMIDVVLEQFKQFKHSIQESVHSYLKDNFESKYNEEKSFIQDELQVSQMEQQVLHCIIDDMTNREEKNIKIQDYINALEMVLKESVNEFMMTSSEESYYKLFKHYLKHPNKFPLIERYYLDVLHDLQDKYIMDVEDVVQYTLGLIGNGKPLGVFRLGVNTLQGEVENK